LKESNLTENYNVLSEDNTNKYKQFYDDNFDESKDQNEDFGVELNFDFINSKDEYNFEGAQKRIE